MIEHTFGDAEAWSRRLKGTAPGSWKGYENAICECMSACARKAGEVSPGTTLLDSLPKMDCDVTNPSNKRPSLIIVI